MVDEIPGVWRNNKFYKHLDSNVCNVVDLYSNHNEVLNALKKELEIMPVKNLFSGTDINNENIFFPTDFKPDYKNYDKKIEKIEQNDFL